MTAAPKRMGTRTVPARALLATLVVAAVAAVAVLATRGRPPGATSAGSAEGLAHVHGLGVDPADGSLLAATHTGLFRVGVDGSARRIGDAVQDTMGFTVVGPGRFLASGHPDPGDAHLRVPGKPPLLGLIESTDGGRTWQPLSLLGEADFHGLVAAHELVYGADATTGRFMVSADGRRWETRSQVALFDFVVDPESSDHVVAMTQQGLVESLDGGRTWTSASGPPLPLLTWDATQGLFGVDPSGRVHHRTAAGWQPRGTFAGRPQELLATSRELYAAVERNDSTVIVVSTDGGTTWRARSGRAGS